MGRLELHVGPHGLEVVVGEDDERPPAVLHTLQDLVRDGGARGPVTAVDQTFVPPGLSPVRPLQPRQESLLYVLGVLAGVGQEHVVFLPAVQEVLGKQIAAPGLGEDEDEDDVTVDIAEYPHHCGHYQQTEPDDDELQLKGLTNFLCSQK